MALKEKYGVSNAPVRKAPAAAAPAKEESKQGGGDAAPKAKKEKAPK